MRHVLNLLSGMMDKWNHTRWFTLEKLMKGQSVKDIAAEISVSDKAIYKSIQAGDLNEVIALFGEITQKLNMGINDNN